MIVTTSLNVQPDVNDLNEHGLAVICERIIVICSRLRLFIHRDLLNVLQVEDFEENVKHLQGLRCDFADAFNAGEVLQICDKLLEVSCNYRESEAV